MWTNLNSKKIGFWCWLHIQRSVLPKCFELLSKWYHSLNSHSDYLAITMVSLVAIFFPRSVLKIETFLDQYSFGPLACQALAYIFWMYRFIIWTTEPSTRLRAWHIYNFLGKLSFNPSYVSLSCRPGELSSLFSVRILLLYWVPSRPIRKSFYQCSLYGHCSDALYLD